MAEINRKHKDRLFCMIFKEKKNALSLYNALNHTHYENVDELEITTLEDTIYMHLKNDVSFCVAGDMNLVEHQSTYNGNMALRSLMYYGNLYAAYIDENNLNIHGSKKAIIPTPKSIVMYNGDDKRKEVEIQHLTEHYENPDESGEYQWTAVIYNINKGYNQELLYNCRPLYEYSYLVNLIKDNKKMGYENDEAVDLAVKRCIEEDILADFLKKNRAEVLEVCLTEYDEKKVLQFEREEGREEDKRDVILALYREGDSLDKISRVVNKTIKEIKSILLEQGILIDN